MQGIGFGPFQFYPAERRLLKGLANVEVGSRAFDILAFLIERAGDVVSNQELLARVWPGITVEESSIRVHVAKLRRALDEGENGARYIANVPGRGYSFVGVLSHSRRDAEKPVTSELTSLGTRALPACPTRIVGREVEIQAVVELLNAQRFVTVHGAGGIGKTTLVLAVAHNCTDLYPDGILFLDLGLGTTFDPIPEVLATALGLTPGSGNLTTAIVDQLRHRKILLVLDCCEHVVESVAPLLESIFRETSDVNILTSSRESLNVDGEYVYRLAALEAPPNDDTLNVSQILSYPAAKLFYDRAVSGGLQGTLTLEDAKLLAAITRKVDGLALALELTAGRIGTYGLPEIADHLEGRLGLLWRGRRTAVPRHRTMTATLDWSYDLMSETERLVLTRISRFVGSFSLREAQKVASDDDGIDENDVAQIVDQLVSKSLLTADTSVKTTSYRILDIPRTYIQAKPSYISELPNVSLRHAQCCRERLQSYRQVTSDEKNPSQLDLADAANLRTALEWAFSKDGDSKTGIELTIDAIPLWGRSSKVSEAQEWIGKAIAALPKNSNPRLEMELRAAFGSALVFTKGASDEIEATWTAVLALAEKLDVTDQKLSAIWGLLSNRMNNRDFRGCLPLAKKFREIATASPDASNIYIGDRLIGRTMFFLGDFSGARKQMEQVLSHYDPADRQRDIARYQFDQTVRATSTLAEIYWLQGEPDKAVKLAEENVRGAEATGHELSICTALGQSACPISLLVGDTVGAEKWISRLSEIAARQKLPRWDAWAQYFKGVVDIQRGELKSGLQKLRSVLSASPDTVFRTRYNAFVAELALAAGKAGDLGYALTKIDDALERSELTEERWYTAELLRVKGQILFFKGDSNFRNAEVCYRKSLELAEQQNAKSWELRSSISLAELLRETNRRDEAHVLLSKAFEMFSEGHATIDLLAARRFLDEKI